jgi:hypothetical protein
MEVQIDTTHEVYTIADVDAGHRIRAKVDFDGTAKLFITGPGNTIAETIWLVREDLLALRVVINKVLNLIPRE